MFGSTFFLRGSSPFLGLLIGCGPIWDPQKRFETEFLGYKIDLKNKHVNQTNRRFTYFVSLLVSLHLYISPIHSLSSCSLLFIKHYFSLCHPDKLSFFGEGDFRRCAIVPKEMYWVFFLFRNQLSLHLTRTADTPLWLRCATAVGRCHGQARTL